MKKVLFAILLVLPFLSIAQSNYKPGFIVNSDGATLKGYINYKDWDTNPTGISFKANLADKAANYGTNNINFFEIDGYVSYQKFTITKSLNPVDLSSPPSITDTATAVETSFLKVLQKGKYVTLYGYKDNVKERFYIKNAGMNTPVELLYGIYQDPNSANNIIDKNTYRLQLNQLVVNYLPGNNKLINKVQQSRYKEGDLVQIAALINGNTEAQKVPGAKSNSSVRFYAGGAFISSTLTYADNGPYYNPQPSKSSSPKIVIGADAIVNPDIGRLIFRIEIGYSVNNFSFSDTENPIYNIVDADKSIIKLKQNVLALTPQVIYNFYNTSKLKVFADVGYTADLTSYKTTKTTVLIKGKPASGTTTQPNNPDLSGTYTAFQFKAGVVLNQRVEVYGSYYPGADITRSQVYSADLKAYQFGANYIFGKLTKNKPGR